MGGKEKRGRDRKTYSYSVMCFKKIDGVTQKETIIAMRITVFDISYGGIGIMCQKKIEVGDVLVFNLVVPSTEIRMEFKAKAKWIKFQSGQYKAGIEFVDLSKENIMQVNDILKGKRKKQVASL